MIHAAFHSLAWGLIAVLVWVNFSAEPPSPRGPMSGLAILDDATYLVAHDSDNSAVLGLLKGDAAGARYRALRFDDWDGALKGRTLALCGIPKYDGEVVFLVESGAGQRLVHVQVRNWDRTPKFGVLGVVVLNEPLHSVACGPATEHTVALAGLTQSGALWQAEMRLPSYQLAPQPLITFAEGLGLRQLERPVLYIEPVEGGAQGVALRYWLASATGSGSAIWRYQAESGDWLQAYRVDGFRITGLAAGIGGAGLSFVTGQTGLGSVWRSLERLDIAD